TGGKFWASQDNAEWQTLAAWVRNASGAGTAAPASRTAALDFAYFKNRVQPIFLAKRPGHARCYTCHSTGSPRLQTLPEGTSCGSDEDVRKNFDSWRAVFVPGEPTASRLLMHPLARQAGGDPFHAGGKHWSSQNDPEWQTLAAWVRGASENSSR